MRKLILSAVAAAAVMAAASAHAVPTLIMTLTDTGFGGGTTTCSITSTGFVGVCGTGFSILSGNSPGNLEGGFQGSIFGYNLTFISSQTNTPGVGTGAEINLSFTNVLNKTSNGSLILSVAANEFTLPTGPALTLTGSQGLSQNLNNPGTVTSNYFASATNAPKASAAPTATTSAFANTGTATAIDALSVNWLRNPGAFSLEAAVTFSLAQGNVTAVNGSSNTAARNTVPEPMTTALVGLGLFGAAFFSRRRKVAQV